MAIPKRTTLLLLLLQLLLALELSSAHEIRAHEQTTNTTISVLYSSHSECYAAVYHTPRNCHDILDKCAGYGEGIVNYIQLYYCSPYSSDKTSWHITMAVFLFVWLAQLFVWLGVSASEYFSPNISTLSQALHMPDTLAGVTLLALGNGAPDLFSTFSAVRSGSGALAMGQLIGSASFIVCVVVGATTLVVPEYQVSRLAYLRELSFFVATVGMVTVIVLSEALTQTLAMLMVGLYLVYVITVMVTSRYEESEILSHQQNGEEASSCSVPSSTELFPQDHQNIYNEQTSLLIEPPGHHTAGTDRAGHRRRQTINNVYEYCHSSHSNYSWSIPSQTATNSGTSVRALGEYLQLHPKSLLAATEIGDMVTAEATSSLASSAISGHSSANISNASLLAPDSGKTSSSSSYRSQQLPLPLPTSNGPEETEDRNKYGLSINTKVTTNPTTSEPFDETRIPKIELSPAKSGSHGAILPLPVPTAGTSSISLGNSNDKNNGMLKSPRSLVHIAHSIHSPSVLSPTSSSLFICTFPQPDTVSGELRNANMAWILAQAYIPTLRYWRRNSTIQLKTFIVFSTIPVFLLSLTVPVLAAWPQREVRSSGTAGSHDSTTNMTKAIALASYCRSAISPAFLYSALWYSGYIEFTSNTVVHILICAFMCTMSLLANLAMIRDYCGGSQMLPLWVQGAVPCIAGFMCGIVWIYVVASEIVSIAQALGLTLGVSEEILGLTVIGFGNSLGDLVTNLTLARMGYPMMAISACFGGPMLCLLIGVGVAAYDILVDPDHDIYQMPMTSPAVLVSTGCLLLCSLLYLAAIPYQQYYMTRSIGLASMTIYFVGMAINVYLEW